jgi:hypothetical protein
VEGPKRVERWEERAGRGRGKELRLRWGGLYGVTAVGLAALWWVDGDPVSRWRPAGEIGLLGVIVGYMWVWLWEHRDTLADAARHEAASHRMGLNTADVRLSDTDEGRPVPSRLGTTRDRRDGRPQGGRLAPDARPPSLRAVEATTLAVSTETTERQQRGRQRVQQGTARTQPARSMTPPADHPDPHVCPACENVSLVERDHRLVWRCGYVALPDALDAGSGAPA